MSFVIYLIGFVIVIAGVAWGLNLLGVSRNYIIIVALILFGLGMVTGVSRTRHKDPT